MLTRRGFAGVASCAICGLAGFMATDASAQSAQSTPGLTRKILSQIDGPIPGYTTAAVYDSRKAADHICGLTSCT